MDLCTYLQGKDKHVLSSNIFSTAAAICLFSLLPLPIPEHSESLFVHRVQVVDALFLDSVQHLRKLQLFDAQPTCSMARSADINVVVGSHLLVGGGEEELSCASLQNVICRLIREGRYSHYPCPFYKWPLHLAM